MNWGQDFLRNWRASLRPRWAMMPSANAALLAEALLVVASIFEAAGVVYTVHHGCLLGTTRLRGLLPWDIDADLFLVGETGDSFKAKVGGPLSEFGFALEERAASRYFVVRPAISFFGYVVPLFPIVEVDLLQESTDPLGRIVYDQHASHRRWDAGELLAIGRYAFYGTWLAGPRDPEPVLARLYREAGSPKALGRFRPACLPVNVDHFWQQVRPYRGEPDWPRIWQRAEQFRRRLLGRCLISAPWYILNGLYSILVQSIRRKAGGHIE